MRLGLDLTSLTPQAGGGGRYACELVGALLAEHPDLRVTAFASRELPDTLPWAGEVEWVTLPLTVTHGPPWNFAKLVGAQWGLIAWHAARRRLEVVHGVANVAPLAIPRAAIVVTLHDLIWMRFGDTMTRRETLGNRLLVPASARRATRIIAGAESAKRDAVERLRLDPARIDVIAHGVSGPTVAPAPDVVRRLGLGPQPVILSVAQKRVHKNLEVLIRALPQLDAQLVLVGAPTPHEASLSALAAKLGVGERVHFPAWLDAADLEGAYASATVFALPSLEEGFGLPVLEAMVRGVPVACSDVSALPEVAGGAAELFDPLSPDHVARALRSLLAAPARRAELIERGRARAAELTWARTARETLATYDRARSCTSA